MSAANTKDKKDDIEDLEFVRVFTPQHIPTYLVEQIKDRDFTVEQFYSFQEINCLRNTENGPVLNPLNLLYVIVNKKKIAKGFAWMMIDPLTQDLVVQTYSMDNEYWFKGKAVKLLYNKVKEIISDCNLNKVYWITKYPKHSERYGFKPSKHVLMEYMEEPTDGKNNKAVTGGDSRSIDTATKAIRKSGTRTEH